jgi:hypothetical protein
VDSASTSSSDTSAPRQQLAQPKAGTRLVARGDGLSDWRSPMEDETSCWTRTQAVFRALCSCLTGDPGTLVPEDELLTEEGQWYDLGQLNTISVSSTSSSSNPSGGATASLESDAGLTTMAALFMGRRSQWSKLFASASSSSDEPMQQLVDF